MANAKIHINLQQGLIEVEGDEAFVAKVYEDFKSRVSTSTAGKDKSSSETNLAGNDTGNGATRVVKSGRGITRKQKESGSDTGKGVSGYKPNLDPNLNLASFAKFVAKYVPRNAPQQILLYACYIRDELKISPCSFDQIYTCMKEVGVKVPTAFGQAFIDARGNKHAFIDFSSPTDVVVTIKGDNFVNLKMEKAKE